MHIAVIGAGAAGIGAVNKLLIDGIDEESGQRSINRVTLLEARDRIGGRVYASKLTKNLISADPNDDREAFILIQLDANWIHGLDQRNPMFCAAQDLSLELQQTSSDDEPGEDVLLFDCSKAISNVVGKGDYENALKRYFWMQEYVEELLKKGRNESEELSSGSSRTLQDCFAVALNASEQESRFGVCPVIQLRCLHWFYDRVAIDLAAPLDQTDINCYMEGGTSDGEDGEALVVRGGYSTVLEHIFDPYPSRKIRELLVDAGIRRREFKSNPSCISMRAINTTTNATANNIPDGESSSNGTCNDDDNDQSKYASTLPYVLRMGTMNVVWLWFPTFFWESITSSAPAHGSSSHSSSSSDSDKSNHHWHPNSREIQYLGRVRESSDYVKFSTFLIPRVYDNHGRRQAVLMCQVVEPYAIDIELMTEQEVAAEATQSLREMFRCNSTPSASVAEEEQEGGGRGADISSITAPTCALGSGQSLPPVPVVPVVAGPGVWVPDAIGCTYSRWHSDVWSRGSWSYHQSQHTHTQQAHPVRVGSRNTGTGMGDSCKASSSTNVNPLPPPQPSSVTMSTVHDSCRSTTLTTPPPMAAVGSATIEEEAEDECSDDDEINRRIYYCGEAVAVPNRGTVHGAYLSGEAEATRLLQDWKKTQRH